jgi:hypothetical protein
MVDQVWLHIGMPKAGSSSLQQHLSDNREALAEQGLAYLSPERRTSANELAIAINRDRPGLAEMAAELNAEVESRPEKLAMISSEMFYGMAPGVLLDLLPALRDRPLHVLAYLRRQDRYIEAKFLQKSKNGRFQGTVDDYIARFGGSGSDIWAALAPWDELGGQIRLVPRVLERARLEGGDVVADAFAQMGLPAPQDRAESPANVSPGLHRVQLLQAAAGAGVDNLRRLQRRLAARYPQQPEERGPVMSQDQRRAFLSGYAEGNEALRARYFPDWTGLFDESDLDRADQPGGIPAFTPEQLEEITRLLRVVRDS